MQYLWLALSLLAVSEGALKQWQADSNYDNPNNWSPTRTPCPKDYVHFEPDKKAVVYLTTKTDFQEMLLPMNGEFIFGKNAELGMAEPDRTCDGSVLKYTGANTRNWHDPENWSIKSDYLLHYDIMINSLPVPHAELIPCDGDDVVFLPERSFHVNIQVNTIAVQSITINDQAMDSHSLEEMMQDSKQLLFQGHKEILLQNYTCGAKSGCVCNNNNPEIMSVICSNAASRCPVLECSDPVKPDGHCCQMCGSVMKMNYGKEFQLDLLGSFIDAYLRKEQFLQVTAYISKTASKKIQVVILDTLATRGSAAHLAEALSDELQSDRKHLNVYDVTHIQRTSTLQWNKIEPGALTAGVGAGSVIGILLGIIILLFLVVGLVVLYKKYKLPGFSFARFDAEMGKVELELGTTPHEALDPVGSDIQVEEITKGFDNPLYGSTAKKIEKSERKGEQSYIQELRVNPTYKDDDSTSLPDDDNK